MVQDLKVLDPILSFDAQYRTQALHVKGSNSLMCFLCSPGLTSIKKANEDNCLINLELGGLLDVVLIQHTSLNSAQGLICLADPGIYPFFEEAIIGNDTYLNYYKFIASATEMRNNFYVYIFLRYS